MVSHRISITHGGLFAPKWDRFKDYEMRSERAAWSAACWLFTFYTSRLLKGAESALVKFLKVTHSRRLHPRKRPLAPCFSTRLISCRTAKFSRDARGKLFLQLFACARPSTCALMLKFLPTRAGIIWERFPAPDKICLYWNRKWTRWAAFCVYDDVLFATPIVAQKSWSLLCSGVV